MHTDELINNASNFLLNYAKAENGFFSQNTGIGRGSTPSTANAILALYSSKTISDDTLNNLIEELFSFQYSSQAKYAYSFCTEEVSSNWSTSKAIYVILKTYPKYLNQSRVTYALDWLIENRNDDFGWGYRKNDPSRPYYTFFVAQALLEARYLLQDENLSLKYEKILEEIHLYLSNSCRKDGLWTNGSGNEICPINTLMAMATLKLIEPFSLRNNSDLKHWESSLSFIKENFMNSNLWKNWTWDEPGIAYKKIEPFPPGKVDILLNLYDPFDEVVIYLISWIRKNVIFVDKVSIGWLPPQSKVDKPYSWSTARCLSSLSSFKSSIQNCDRLKDDDFLGTKTGVKWKYVNKKLFTVSMYSYAIILTIFYSILVYKFINFPINNLFDFKDLTNILGSFFLIIFPIILLWIFTFTFVNQGAVKMSEIFQTVKGKIDKIKIW